MTITPDQAQEWLDGATPGPWAHDEVPGPGEDPTRATDVYPKGEYGVIAYVQPSAADVELIAAAPDMAETIAGMEVEWGVEHDNMASSPFSRRWTQWYDDETKARNSAAVLADMGKHPVLVRRLVSSPEVIEGE